MALPDRSFIMPRLLRHSYHRCQRGDLPTAGYIDCRLRLPVRVGMCLQFDRVLKSKGDHSEVQDRRICTLSSDMN